MTVAQIDPNPVAERRPRVLVVDDHRTFADLLSGALDASGMTCVGTANTAAQAVAMAAALAPDIVVMDIQMPREDGLSADPPHPGGRARRRRGGRDRAPRPRLGGAGGAGRRLGLHSQGRVARPRCSTCSAGSRPGRCSSRRPPSPAGARSGGPARRPENRAGPDPPRAAGSRLPRPRDAGEGHRARPRHHAGDLPRLREVAARQARRPLAAGGGGQGSARSGCSGSRDEHRSRLVRSLR